MFCGSTDCLLYPFILNKKMPFGKPDKNKIALKTISIKLPAADCQII